MWGFLDFQDSGGGFDMEEGYSELCLKFCQIN